MAASLLTLLQQSTKGISQVVALAEQGGSGPERKGAAGAQLEYASREYQPSDIPPAIRTS